MAFIKVGLVWFVDLLAIRYIYLEVGVLCIRYLTI